MDECETIVEKTFASPTYTLDLAHAIARLIRTPHYGLYHVTNSGACTWYQFACKIWELAGLSPKAEPTTTAAFGAVAARPAYSVLDNAALRAVGLGPLRRWEEALAAYLEERSVPGATARR